MAKDPAFLFYPGDYLRDTQNLSEKSQVAYDRIMCEHMRNICEDMSFITVSKKQVDFFIKRLSDEEKDELMFVLTKKREGFQIEWVAESIAKRKVYSNSRSKNREGKKDEDMLTYDSHMEDEKENISVIKNKIRNEIVLPFDSENFSNIWNVWKDYKKREHKFTYKTEISEQGALQRLDNLSNHNELAAIEIIKQSISNGYKGFFELKSGSKISKDMSMQNYKQQIIDEINAAN